MNRSEVASYLARKGRRRYLGLGGSTGGTNPFVTNARLEIEVAAALKQVSDLFSKSSYLVFDDFGELDVFGGVHFVEDGTHIVAADLVVAVLSQIFYEFHDFDAETVSFDPHSKLGVFLLDLTNDVKEHSVHFIPQVMELRRAQVRIIVYHGLYFFPPHF